MPKIITKEARAQIVRHYKINGNQSDTARKFNVSFLFVHYLVNGKPIPRTRPQKNKCPITGW